MKPVVYIASPYSAGNPRLNVIFQMDVWDELLRSGVVLPVAPLWSHFQHRYAPLDYEEWLAYDLEMIRKYDACLRLNVVYGEYTCDSSPGADREEAEFLRQGKPVFHSIEEVLSWAKQLS